MKTLETILNRAFILTANIWNRIYFKSRCLSCQCQKHDFFPEKAVRSFVTWLVNRSNKHNQLGNVADRIRWIIFGRGWIVYFSCFSLRCRSSFFLTFHRNLNLPKSLLKLVSLDANMQIIRWTIKSLALYSRCLRCKSSITKSIWMGSLAFHWRAKKNISTILISFRSCEGIFSMIDWNFVRSKREMDTARFFCRCMTSLEYSLKIRLTKGNRWNYWRLIK